MVGAEKVIKPVVGFSSGFIVFSANPISIRLRGPSLQHFQAWGKGRVLSMGEAKLLATKKKRRSGFWPLERDTYDPLEGSTDGIDLETLSPPR